MAADKSGDFRPITVIRVLQKIYMKMILAKMQETMVNVGETSFGFSAPRFKSWSAR